MIERLIGTGGFGTVYKAAHPLIGKVGAIKVLKRQYSALPEMVSRFVAEARAVNQIRHRNIIDIFGFGQLEDGRHYYVMELLEGTTLDVKLAADGPIAFADAMPIFRAIARALDAAHAKDIAHRDLKPANVFLATEVDGTVFPKLLDFGIAKLLTADKAGPMHKTRTGAPIGTPFYMSPEQCRGRDVDHRTDVYALGVVVCEVLTGKVPFSGEDAMDVLFAQMNDAPPPPSSIRPGLPESVDRAVAWMLMKDPAARPPSAGAAVAALEDAAATAGIPLAVERSKTPSVAGKTTGSKNRNHSMAQAATLDAERMTPAPPLAKRPPWVIPVAFAAVGALAVGGYFVLRSPAQGSSTSTSTSTDSGSGSAPDPDTAAGSAADPAAGSAATPSSVITITVSGPPPGTEVYVLGQLLGTAPGAIQLPREAKPCVLTFKADGYVSRSLTLTPDRDQPASITLDRKATGRPSTGSKPVNPRDRLGPDPFKKGTP